MRTSSFYTPLLLTLSEEHPIGLDGPTPDQRELHGHLSILKVSANRTLELARRTSLFLKLDVFPSSSEKLQRASDQLGTLELLDQFSLSCHVLLETADDLTATTPR